MMTKTLLLCCALSVACGPPPYARKAQQLLVAGDLNGAQQIVDRELPNDPKEPTLWGIKVRIALARHQMDQAVAIYRDWRTLRKADDHGVLRVMALSTLWTALSSPAAELRAQAIVIIEKQELHALAREVSKHFNDDDIIVRTTAAAAILSAHPDAPLIITEALRSNNAEARRIAVEVLGRKTARSAADEIFNALSDKNNTVRAEACLALAHLKTAKAQERLIAVLSKDDDPTVRTAAINALTAMKSTAARAAIMPLLGDDYLGARLAALGFLDRTFGVREHATYLELSSSTDPFVALRATVLLARHGDDSRSSTALAAGLAAKQWTVRVAALGALSQLAKGETALTLARPLLRDPDEHVRVSAAHAVAHLGDRKAATGALMILLGSANATTQLTAALELDRLNDPRGNEILTHTASPDLRRRAFLSVQQRDHVHDMLLSALADPVGKNRIAAAERILQKTQ